MKAVLAILAFSGLILCINAECDKSACKEVTDKKDHCDQWKTYVDCLNTEADACKATAGDVARKLALKTLIGAENIDRKIQGCGACAVTVSATTLLLALVAAFMKM